MGRGYAAGGSSSESEGMSGFFKATGATAAVNAPGVFTRTGPLTFRPQVIMTRRRFLMLRFIPTSSFVTRSYLYYLPDEPDNSR
jgi:hypothetical protein